MLMGYVVCSFPRVLGGLEALAIPGPFIFVKNCWSEFVSPIRTTISQVSTLRSVVNSFESVFA